MSNTSVDKFAERPYWCDIITINSGKGQWYNEGYSGGGMPDNKDGSGYAKGYTPYANNQPSHYLFDVKIKQ